MECRKCESGDTTWVVETTSSQPYGTGYDALACESCGELFEDDGTTATRVWVGH